MIWTAAKFKGQNQTGSPVRRDRPRKFTKLSQQLKKFCVQFWRFSAYYGEFVAGGSVGPTSRGDRDRQK